jgi:hypothetical protein
VQEFFRRYVAFPPGCAHRLIVATKGWEAVPGLDEVRSLAEAHGAATLDLPDDGLDWGVYMRLAPELSEPWICVLNSFSRPTTKRWLHLLQVCASEPGVGAVGATGSWESNLSSGVYFPYDLKSLIEYPLRLAYGCYRYLRYAKVFPGYPNPHLRSNAFLMKTELFAEFCAQREIPHSKLDALIMECGASSVTHFVLSRGLDVRVVGADGNSFGPRDWNRSHTFRTPGQRNLLVHDNRTRLYEMQERGLRRAIERATWGEALTP